MNTRHLVILALVAITGLVAVFWSQSIDEVASVESPLYPGLFESINDIDRVVISDESAGQTVTLERGAQAWTVQEVNGYTADAGKLRALLLALSRAMRVEEKTSNPENYARLGVADPGSGDGAALSISLSGTGTPAALLVGRTSQGQDGTYVRFAGDAPSWLIDETLNVDREPMDWVDRLVVDVAPESIKSLSIVDAGGERFSIGREESGTEYQFENLPEGRQINQGAANRLAGEFGSFNFDDVSKEESAADPESFTVSINTFGGARISATLSKTDDKHYMTLAASAGGESAPAEDTAELIRAIERRAGWRFEIPAFKYSQLNKTRDDLLEDAA